MGFPGFFKKNNRGSSLIIAIVAVGFVGILATVILSSAVTSYQLKTMDSRTKKTFYSAESALQELYSGLGVVCYKELETAYTGVVTNLLTQVNTGGSIYYVQMDNEEANAKMKTDYYKAMEGLFPDSTKSAEYLSSFMKDKEHAGITSVGKITVDDTKQTVTLEDVVVRYLKGSDSVYQTVTVDIDITYPDINMDFTDSNSNSLSTYLDYCLIGMDSVNFGYNQGGTPQKAVSTLSGNLFAGKGGLQINAGSTVLLQDLIPYDNVINTTVVTSGDVSIHPGAVASTLNVGGVNLWCNNINVGAAGDSVPSLLNYLTGYNSSTYVADDLNIQSNNCQVTLGNSYYGFGYQGSLQDASYSSAIIINGKNTTLNTITLNNLLLGGRAYLNFGDSNTADDYMTADSLALKGNQEIYLVPSNYVVSSNATIDATNPASVSPADPTSGLTVDMKGFFAYDMGLLDTANPYTVKETKPNTYYIYLNFKNNQDMVTYVKCVMDLSYLKSAAGSLYKASYETDWNNLNLIIEKSISKFVAGGSVGLSMNSASSVVSSGSLFEVSSKGMGVYNVADSSTDTILNLCLDKTNRYAVMKSFLTDIGGSKPVLSMPPSITVAGVKFPTANMSTTDIYTRAVDISLLQSQAVNYTKTTGTTLAAVVTDKDTSTASGRYTIPSGITGGVILAYNVDVYVNASFEGLIMTNKNIYVSGNSNLVTTGTSDKASQVLDSDANIGKFFYAYKLQSGSDSGLAKVTLKDMLNFDNWRKNDGN